jgi:cytochrome P450
MRTVLERDDVFRVDIYGEKMRATSGAFFLGMDAGPDYDREQKLGMAALGRDHALVQECVGRLSQALIDGALDRPSRTLDVVNELTHVVQLNLIKEYFGVPDTHDERLLGWLETMSFFIFNFWVSGPYKAAAIEAGQAMGAHLERIVRERLGQLATQHETKDDVLGRMMLELGAQSGKAPVDQNLVVRTMGGLVSGGTIPAIGTFVAAVDKLLDLPPGMRKELQEAALTGNDVTVRRFVREAARFSAYPPTLYRHACKPYIFAAGTSHEKEVEEGAWVVTAPLSANFDATVFPRPEVFDQHRKESSESAPLLFGWSRHRCLGEHMAEMVMVEMAKRLFARSVRRARGAAGTVTSGPAGMIPDGNYPRRLVVRFD